ncbi:hypothetical protein PoB_004679500 [Plakobranchus ocellatus]|uniref:Uncharacterized protein n=1 Tax=Plakobranchus ocellatus TaxID=259542 RepID=A0AAV4BIF8_9GAST|nr:hypothetical protein PoB_004679500 [Plakobranchus ocellatus]
MDGSTDRNHSLQNDLYKKIPVTSVNLSLSADFQQNGQIKQQQAASSGQMPFRIKPSPHRHIKARALKQTTDTVIARNQGELTLCTASRLLNQLSRRQIQPNGRKRGQL